MIHNDKITTAIWSSDWSEHTGQTIVTKRVFEHQTDVKWIVTTYGSAGLASIFGVFGASLRLYMAALAGRFSQVYLVSSRSQIGFLRDLPALALAFLGFRIVAHVRGSDIIQLLEQYRLSWISRRLYSRCEIVVPSAHLVQDVERLTGRKPVVCENFIEEIDQDAYVERGSKNSECWVTWNSNIMSSKGFLDVADAVAIARKQDPRFRLLVVGKPMGDIELTKKQIIEKLDAIKDLDWLSYLGPVQPAAALQATERADIYVFPSRYPSECQPLSLIQAMILAKPIVVADTPALRATLGSYPAHFLSAISPAKLAESMLALARRDPSEVGELILGAQLARQRFSSSRFDETMAQILKSQYSPSED